MIGETGMRKQLTGLRNSPGLQGKEHSGFGGGGGFSMVFTLELSHEFGPGKPYVVLL